MKLQITRDALNAAVTAAARIVPLRPVDPLLGGILIETDLASVSLSAYDYERSVTVLAIADVEQPDRVLVSGRLLAAVAKVLPAKPVTIEVDGDMLHITAGAARLRLPTMPTENYPTLPVPATGSGTMKGGDFVDAVTRAAGTTLKDEFEAMQMLNSISIETAGDHVIFTSTDRHRLSTQVATWEPFTEFAGATQTLVAGSMLVDLAKTVDSTDIVTLHIGERTFGVTTPRVEATVRVIDASFPDYVSLFPSEFVSTVVVDTAELIDALKRAVVTTDRVPHVSLDFRDDAVHLQSAGEGVGSSVEAVAIDLDGEPIAVKCNGLFLLNGLVSCASEQVTIGLMNSVRPLYIYPGGRDLDVSDEANLLPPESTYRHLVMPVDSAA